jgi:hypothetical protein
MAMSARKEGPSRWRIHAATLAATEGDPTGRQVTDAIKRVKARITKDEADLAALEALRQDMRAAKAKTAQALPDRVRDRHRELLAAGSRWGTGDASLTHQDQDARCLQARWPVRRALPRA